MESSDFGKILCDDFIELSLQRKLFSQECLKISEKSVFGLVHETYCISCGPNVFTQFI